VVNIYTLRKLINAELIIAEFIIAYLPPKRKKIIPQK